MFNVRNLCFALACALPMSFVGTAASAATAYCPGPTSVGAKYSVTTSPDSSCAASGTQATADKTFFDVYELLGYQLLDKTDDAFQYAGGLNELSQLGMDFSGSDGEFDLAGLVDGFTNLILLLKGGAEGTGGEVHPWGAFFLGALDGSWNILYNSGRSENLSTLSHASLYGIAAVEQVVPIPPALFLFGTALVGLGFLGRRRRVATRAQAAA